MSTFRLSAARASLARRPSSASNREAARRRSRPLLEPLEGRLVLSGPGTTLDVSTAPYFLQAKLTQSASAPDWTAFYGDSLAITADGDVLAVNSAIRADTPGPAGLPQRGAVEIWERTDREWTRTAILTPPPSAETSFIGRQLAISDDGSTLVASASTSSPDDYSLLVYERDGAGWTFRQDIDAPGDRGGGGGWGQRTGLTVSGDGSVIALGSPAASYPTPAEPAGLVRVYSRAGATWSQTAQLSSPDPGTSWSFGVSVGLSADGTTLAVGASAQMSENTGPGNVFIYHASPSGGWGAPTPVETSGTPWILGEQIALSADGRTLLASAIEELPVTESPTVQGAAYIYEETQAGWQRTARLVGAQPGGRNDFFALWMALSPDGDTAVVGDLAAANARQVHVYGRDSGWGRLTTITPVGGIDATNGPFGGLAASDHDFVVRSVPTTAWTVDVYHRPAGFEVILDPSDLASSPGVPTTFLAAASDATGVDVRWQSSGDGGSTWADIPGAVYDWYSLTPSLADSGRMFRAVFTDGGGASVTTRPATLTVAKATPLLTVDAQLSPSWSYYLVDFEVVVSPTSPNPSPPNFGLVEVRLTNSAGVAYVFGGTVYNGRATIPGRDTRLAPGTYSVVATYNGHFDPNYGDASTTFELVAARFDADFQAELTDPSPAFGEMTTLIVQAGPFLSTPTPTGLIAVWDGAELLGVAAMQPTDGGDWKAEVSFRITAAGSRTYRWTYTGNDVFLPESHDITLDVARPVTTIVATPASGSPTHSFGEQPRFDVVVRTTDGLPATGAVKVTVDGSPFSAQVVDLGPDGRASVDLPADVAPGGHVVTFEYLGTSDFQPSTALVGIGVHLAPTSLALESTAVFVQPGDPASFKARVQNATGAIAPTSGVVRFYIDGALAAEVPIGVDGTATYSTTTLAAGWHDVIAVFPQTENFQGSVSNRLAQNVGRFSTATQLWSTRNPSTAGESLEFVARAAPAPNQGFPMTGVVRFYLGLNPIAEVPVDANGHAVLPARFDAAGSYQITAVYLGNTYYDTSMSIHLGQVVQGPAVVAQAAPAPAAPRSAVVPTASALSVSSSAVAAEEARVALTPAQARRAAFAARLAARRSAFRPMRG